MPELLEEQHDVSRPGGTCIIDLKLGCLANLPDIECFTGPPLLSKTEPSASTITLITTVPTTVRPSSKAGPSSRTVTLTISVAVPGTIHPPLRGSILFSCETWDVVEVTVDGDHIAWAYADVNSCDEAG